MTEELVKIHEELAMLRRVVSKSMRQGTVHKSKDGRVLVHYKQGDGGDAGGAVRSTWIRTGHGGAQSDDRQYAEGETVTVFCAGGNDEHAMLFPGGFSDDHPRDGNATDDSSTRRWRKPPEDKDQQGGDQAGGQDSGGGGSQYGSDQKKGKKWKDDKDDLQQHNSHKASWSKIGDVESHITKDGGFLKHGDRKVSVDKDGTYLTDGKATIKVKGGKIYLIGEVFLGDEGASDRIATEKTRDSMGKPLMPPFSSTTKAK